jgi:chromosome segregation ATPase
LAEPILASVIEKFLEDYLAKMSEKLAKGEKLTQAEAALLMASVTQRDVSRLMKALDDTKADTNKRIDDVRTELLSKLEDTNKRIDDTNKRIDDIKQDIKDVKQDMSYIRHRLDELADGVLKALTGIGGKS